MKPTEADFESYICDQLVSRSGWNAVKIGNHEPGDIPDFDPKLGIDTAELFAFISATQNDAWDELARRHGGVAAHAQTKFLTRLASELDRRGTIDVLRHGVDDLGVTIAIAYFRPAHGLTPALVDRYRSNRLTVTRQLPYDPASTKTLDLGLFLNGIPVATAELKNPLTGQRVDDAMAQYRRDRDPRNITLDRRAVVHFAFDTELVAMTTRLTGRTTRFLPFNQGHDHRAGNPPNPEGHRTAYLWERVWERDAWCDLLARFVHVEPAPKGSRARPGVIFPRYHQWDAVLRLEAAARREGPGHNYLVQHSAGSGKSNTIAWLAHRLSNLHDGTDTKVFDKVVVITDRVVLDRQLQDTVYQFEHAHGVVVRIEKDSAQLAEALAGDSARIVITTLQKFPYVLDKIDGLPARSYAVVVDEAHSSQTGEAAKQLKAVLGSGDTGRDPAPQETDSVLEPDVVDDALIQAVAARGRQPNLSFFAFTATPKGKTLELFGRLDPDAPADRARHVPFHLYPMRQAIDEGFIVDVLAHYTTYETFSRIEKSVLDDPDYDTAAARTALARFLTLHESNLAQKAEIVIEHFRTRVAGKIAGRAKAMVVCSSRRHAVRFGLALRRHARAHGYDPGVLVAFSGTVTDDGVEYTEAGINAFADTETAERFATDDWRILVVAEKFQTGFDQPLLHTMYVDKTLTGLAAVQTLSRLNRIHPDKTDTFVLDFRNDAIDIRAAFEPYYGTTVAPPTDPNLLFDTRRALEVYGVLRTDEIAAVVALLLAPDGTAVRHRDTERVHAALTPAIDRVGALDDDERDRFVDDLGRFVRIYSFLSQIVPFTDRTLERDYVFCRALAAFVRRDAAEAVDLGSDVELTHLRVEERFDGSISLAADEGEVATVFSGTGSRHDPEPESLSTIIEAFNERFGTDWNEGDRLVPEQVIGDLVADERVQLEAGANTMSEFGVGFEDRYLDAAVGRLDRNGKVIGQILDDEALRKALIESSMPRVYARARVARQWVCPIGDLLGADREDLGLEYKSTLRWDIQASSKKTGIPGKAVVKTIAGFANAEAGGTLLIGVADDGTVHGLDDDYATFTKRDRGTRDLFGQHLQSLLVGRLGDAAAALATWEFFTVDGHDLVRVAVAPSDFPVFAGTGDDDRTFYWRYPSGTKAVTDERERRRLIARRFGVGADPDPDRTSET